jgi:hypothetical protein
MTLQLFCVFQEQTLSYIEKHPVLMEGDVFTELPQHLKKEVQQAITVLNNKELKLYTHSSYFLSCLAD